MQRHKMLKHLKHVCGAFRVQAYTIMLPTRCPINVCIPPQI